MQIVAEIPQAARGQAAKQRPGPANPADPAAEGAPVESWLRPSRGIAFAMLLAVPFWLALLAWLLL